MQPDLELDKEVEQKGNFDLSNTCEFTSKQLLDDCINDGGKLLVWGCGEFGQHGHGHQNDISLSTGRCNPLLLGQDVLVTKVACGSSHTVCMTDDNRIYSWGNGNSGQLGIGQSKTVFQPHAVQLGVSLGTRVKGMTCGTRHTFVWTDNGECYSFGNNFSAQLGYDFRKPDFKENQPRPVYLETLFNQNVVQVACGSRHSLFLFSSGTMASVGSNDRGQLGLDSKVESVCVKNIPDIKGISVIGCGNCHCLAADGDGNVYAWGYGKACGSKDDILSPTCIYTYDDRRVATVQGGDSHSLLLLDDGTIYSWGVNFEGQLGLGESITFQSSPAEIKHKALKGKVLSISVGENTSAATTDEGHLYMWGRNVSQVIRDDEGPRYCQFYPYFLSFGNWKASKVSCGSWHVACIVTSQNVPTEQSLSSIESTVNSDLSEMLYKKENDSFSSENNNIYSHLDSNGTIQESDVDEYRHSENMAFSEQEISEFISNLTEKKQNCSHKMGEIMEMNERTGYSNDNGDGPNRNMVENPHRLILNSDETSCVVAKDFSHNSIIITEYLENPNSKTSLTANVESGMTNTNCKSKLVTTNTSGCSFEIERTNEQDTITTHSSTIQKLNFEKQILQMDKTENEFDKECSDIKPSINKVNSELVLSEKENELQNPILGEEKLVTQTPNEQVKCLVNNNKQDVHDTVSEMQKPSSAPGREMRRNSSYNAKAQLRRTQSEDSSVCKTIFDLVPTKHGGALEYSRLYCDVKAERQRNIKTSQEQRRSIDSNMINYSNKDGTSFYDEENNNHCKGTLFCSTKGTDISQVNKSISLAGNKDVKAKTEDGSTETLLYMAKKTEQTHATMTTTQLRLSGQLNREKKAPRHLRKATSTLEYQDQPFNTTDATRKHLQRAQSNPNMNIAGHKLDVQLQPTSSSTPTTPPTHTHLPHPPSTSGLPPRPPGARRPHSKKIFYSSGSSWRKRTPML